MKRALAGVFVVLGIMGCAGSGGSGGSGGSTAAKRAARPKTAEVETSDPAAVAAAVGTYVLETVNDKPLPFLLPTKVTLNTASLTIKADGTYTSGGTWSFEGKAGQSGGEGTFIASDTRITTSSSGVRDTVTIVGDLITRIGDDDVYVYKRAAAGTVPDALGPSGDPIEALMIASQAVVIEAGLQRYMNTTNGRGTGFAQPYATGKSWTMWPDVPTNADFFYAIFVPRTARNPQATLTVGGTTYPFKLLDKTDTGKMVLLMVRLEMKGDGTPVEVEINYTCETPEMAMLVLYKK